MPFTLAHPIAVVPLHKALNKWSAPSALVIGSMLPDATYFLPVGLSRPQGHSLLAMFLFCLPFGLVLYVCLHHFFKKPFCFLLPNSISRRIPPRYLSSTTFSWTNIPNAGLCILIGAATHLLWDSFTHAGFFFVERIPLLSKMFFNIGGYHVYGYSVLQHGSTFFGLFALFLLYSLLWFTLAQKK